MHKLLNILSLHSLKCLVTLHLALSNAGLTVPLLCRVARESKDPDLDIPMNAAPKSDPAIPETLSKYFSLDKDFNPVGVNNILSSIIISVYDKHCLQGSFYGKTEEYDETEAEVKDYII